MQLNLTRVDLGSTGTAERSALKVLPISAEPGQGQRVVVGDSYGVLQSFYFKSNSLVQVFKSAPGPRKINCIACGMGPSQRDKTFVAEGSVIKGYDLKGTQFFRFTTPLTEDITSLAVAGSTLFTFTSSCVTIFDETTERCTYIAPEAITATAVAPLLSAETWWALIGCHDRTIKVLNDAKVAQEIPLPAVPTALTYVTLSHDVFNKHPTRKEVWAGLANGALLQLFLDAGTCHHGTALSAADSGKSAAVTQVHSGFDSAQDGLDDIVVGREDGSVEIYHMDGFGRLVKCWEASVRQSIAAIASGHVTSAGEDDYLVHTFGGAILAFTAGPNPHISLPAATATAPAEDAAAAACAAKQRAIEAANQELQALDAELQAKRKKLAARSTAMVARSQLLPLKHVLRLDAARAVYELSLEATVPIFCVGVLASVDVTFLETPSSAAILTVCDPAPGSSAVKLATYRCHDSMSRVVVLMRIPEGQAGTVSAYVVPRAAPKTSAAVTHSVHALCMHHRVHAQEVGGTYGHVDVTGDFSMHEMHAWLSSILPDMPRHSAEAEVRLAYRSAALGTHVVATYRDGSARFASDNAAALSLLRAALTRHANDSQVHVRVITRMEKPMVLAFLKRLWEPLQELRQKEHGQLLQAGVQHLVAAEGDSSFLTDKMQAILTTANEASAKDVLGPACDSDSLVQQLLATQAEWMRQQGRTPTAQDAERLERAATDRRTSLARITQLVAAEG
eukprot:jgi/Ulvmu1/10315/UM060_0117.1